MTQLIPWIVAAATAVYILAPLFGFTNGRKVQAANEESWHTLPQLEADRELGKIDETEYQEMKRHATAPPLWNVEGLIYALRRARRLDVAVEAEVLIQRARRENKKDA